MWHYLLTLGDVARGVRFGYKVSQIGHKFGQIRDFSDQISILDFGSPGKITEMGSGIILAEICDT